MKKINADIFVCMHHVVVLSIHYKGSTFLATENTSLSSSRHGHVGLLFFQRRAKMGWLLRYWLLLPHTGAWLTMSLMQFESQQTGWETKWKTVVCMPPPPPTPPIPISRACDEALFLPFDSRFTISNITLIHWWLKDIGYNEWTKLISLLVQLSNII